jgi:hypothetical protein
MDPLRAGKIGYGASRWVFGFKKDFAAGVESRIYRSKPQIETVLT